jgi:hypothetical protein
MPLLTESERRFLKAVSGLAYANPFLPERTQFEKAALGRDYVHSGPVWSASVSDPDAPGANVVRLHARLSPLIENIARRIKTAPSVSPEELAVYEDNVHYLLYQRYYSDFVSARTWGFYEKFAADWRALLPDSSRFETGREAPHFFACFRQVQRRFIISSTTSSGIRCPLQDCGRPPGNRFSPTIRAATAANYTREWATFRP